MKSCAGRLISKFLAGALVVVAQQAGRSAGLDLNDSESASRVGDYGDLTRMTFIGNESFSPETLRDALRLDLDAVIMLQPDAGLTECLGTLQRHLRAGYQHEGFPAATVQSGLNSANHSIVIRIVEGHRFNCGEVLVTGLKKLSVPTLTAQILKRISPEAVSNAPPSLLAAVGTTNQPDAASIMPGSSPSVTPITNRNQMADVPLGIWVANQPAPLDAGTRRSLQEAVTNAFADLGYFSPRFKVVFVPEEQQKGGGSSRQQRRLMDLQVKVLDEGPPCTIGKIEVSPLKKNLRTELLRWLNLSTGQRLTRELLLEKQRQLEESGRFTVAMLDPGKPDDAGKVKLRIRLRELDVAPPLMVHLPPEEAALQQLRTWLLNWTNRPEDAVIRLKANKIGSTNSLFAELIVSPQGGVLFRLKATVDSAVRADWWFSVRSNMVALIDGRQRVGLYTTNWHGSLKLNTGLGVDPEGEGNFFVAGEFDSSTSQPPFQVGLRLRPVAFIRMAHLPRVQWQLEQGVLTGLSSNFVLRTDAKTGRLIEWRYATEDGGPGMFAEALKNTRSTGEMSVQFTTNAFAKVLSESMPELAGYTNFYDAQHPVSSVMAYLAGEALRIPVVRKMIPASINADAVAAAGPVLGKIFTPGLFSPWERVCHATNREGRTESFFIPPEESELSGTCNPLDSVVAWILGNSSEIAAPQSWVSTLLSERALSVSRRADRVGRGLKRLFTTTEIGPLACLMASRSLNSQAARSFAIKGMVCLSSENFRRDCRALLEGDGAVPATVRRFLVQLAKLNDSDVNVLAALLSPSDAAALRDAVRVLRQPGATPSMKTLGPVLERWWAGSLKARFRSAMMSRISNTAGQ